MSKNKSRPTMTDVLRAAVESSAATQYKIAQDTGILATSLSRFMRGETSIVLDKADKLAAYLGLHLVPDPDAEPPEPTPENLARPMLAKRRRGRRRRASTAQKAE